MSHAKAWKFMQRTSFKATPQTLMAHFESRHANPQDMRHPTPVSALSAISVNSSRCEIYYTDINDVTHYLFYKRTAHLLCSECHQNRYREAHCYDSRFCCQVMQLTRADMKKLTLTWRSWLLIDSPSCFCCTTQQEGDAQHAGRRPWTTLHTHWNWMLKMILK